MKKANGKLRPRRDLAVAGKLVPLVIEYARAIDDGKTDLTEVKFKVALYAFELGQSRAAANRLAEDALAAIGATTTNLVPATA